MKRQDKNPLACGQVIAALFFAAILTLSQQALADTTASQYLAGGLRQMSQGQLIDARSTLSAALFSGQLTAAEEATAVKALTSLAQQTIFSATICEGDPIAYAYTVRPGDTLSSIQRRTGAYLPPDLVEDINQIDASQLTPGTVIKMLRGPFCAQISKHSYSLDVYLKAGDQKIFVRRAKVAIGRNDGTPEGAFRIAGKAKHATWVPPKSMAKKYTAPVEWGQKGYPLGKDGYFMSLRGIDANTRSVKGYGIHGTNDQSSIGKPRSHGCVRVGEKDIGTLFSLFTEGASLVQIVD